MMSQHHFCCHVLLLQGRGKMLSRPLPLLSSLRAEASLLLLSPLETGLLWSVPCRWEETLSLSPPSITMSSRCKQDNLPEMSCHHCDRWCRTLFQTVMNVGSRFPSYINDPTWCFLQLPPLHHESSVTIFDRHAGSVLFPACTSWI